MLILYTYVSKSIYSLNPRRSVGRKPNCILLFMWLVVKELIEVFLAPELVAMTAAGGEGSQMSPR